MEISVLIAISIGLLLLLWENLVPRRFYTKRLKLHSYTVDLLLAVLNNVVMYILSVTSLYIIASQNFSLNLLSGIDFSNIFIIILTLIFLDFMIYFWHYMNHKFAFLWFFHKVHHSEKYLNALSGIRFHIGELLGSVLYKSFFLVFIFGIPLNLILISETIVLLSSLFHHSNIEFKFEKILGKVFVMPYMHEVHHSTKRFEHDNNYGVLFSFWDRLFHTYKETNVKEIGLENVSFQIFFKTVLYGLKKR